MQLVTLTRILLLSIIKIPATTQVDVFSWVGLLYSLSVFCLGMRVVAVARGREHLEKLQQSVIAKGVPAQDFLPVVCDISKDVEVNALPRIVAKRWPESVGVDVLINNAGLSRENSSLVDGSTEMWVDMLAANVLGLSMCSREVVKVIQFDRLQKLFQQDHDVRG